MFYYSAQTVGVIVRLEKETFRVLTMNNKLVNVNSQAVTKKRPNKFAAALDSENKTINPNDVVKVIDGVNKVHINILAILKKL